MGRRQKTSAKTTTQRRKTLRRRKAPKAVSRRRIPSKNADSSEATRLSHELNEALARETATAKVLESMRGSSGDTGPVFEAILDNLLRLFGTRFALILLVRDGLLHAAGIKGPPGFEKMAERYPMPFDENLHSAKAIIAGRALQIVPIIGNPKAPASTQKLASEFSFNALLSVPLVHQGKVVGALNTARPDANTFTDRQVALIKSFADQAVIAIENARLFNETREALERQTATGEILQVISTSLTDISAVFKTILNKCVDLCSGDRAVIWEFDGRALRLVEGKNTSPKQ